MPRLLGLPKVGAPTHVIGLICVNKRTGLLAKRRGFVWAFRANLDSAEGSPPRLPLVVEIHLDKCGQKWTFSILIRPMAASRGPKLTSIVELLIEEFKQTRMFLFGSRASGNVRPDSDYDFVLVVPGNRKDRATNMSRARKLIYDSLAVNADVFVYSQREFDEWKGEFSSIPETAISTGRAFRPWLKVGWFASGSNPLDVIC